MTAAEKLRRAADLLRERAEAATPGPWGWDAWEDGSSCVTTGPHTLASLVGSHVEPPTMDASGVLLDGDLSDQDEKVWAIERAESARHDATFIAAMNPTVALAVADWLDDIAGQQEHCEWIVKTYAKYPDVRWPSTTRALAVADAILAGVEG